MNICTRANRSLYFGVLLAISISGCTQPAPANRKPQKITLRQSDARRLADEGRAEKNLEKLEKAAQIYARMGELMLFPEGISYANDLFEQALELSPNNGKANFYGAITRPIQALRGIIPRTEKLLKSDAREKVENLKEQLEEINIPELKEFLLHTNGKKKFEEYSDFQRFLRTEVLPEILIAEERFEKLAKAGKEIELNINLRRLNSNFVEDTIQTERTEYCYQSGSELECHTYESDFSYAQSDRPKTIKLDSGDLTVLHNAARGYATFIRFHTAYSFEGANELEKSLSKINTKKHPARAVSKIKEFERFMVLEGDNQIPEIKKSLEFAFRDALALHELQATLCGAETNEVRTEEKRLLKQICVLGRFVERAEKALEALSGPTQVVIGRTAHDSPVSLLVDISALLNNPPRDLKELLPTRFNSKGDAIEYPDPSFGGLFPNRDAIEKFKKISSRSPVVKDVDGWLSRYSEFIESQLDGTFDAEIEI